jgi:hypothetical protein
MSGQSGRNSKLKELADKVVAWDDHLVRGIVEKSLTTGVSFALLLRSFDSEVGDHLLGLDRVEGPMYYQMQRFLRQDNLDFKLIDIFGDKLPIVTNANPADGRVGVKALFMCPE